MKEWLIIGGGIQGITLACYLKETLKVHAKQLTIIDPHKKPLSMWKHCTENVGMSYLRSPSIHHLEPQPFGLEAYIKKQKIKKEDAFVRPYDRPLLSLFNQHSDKLVEEFEIESSWVEDRVCGLSKTSFGWNVQLKSGKEVTSKRVVIAIGLGEHPLWPEWATDLKEKGAEVHHVFEESFLTNTIFNKSIVIGGGISAVQVALKISQQSTEKVHLATRHPLRTKQFDSHPGWLGPKYMRAFIKEESIQKRREKIKQARNRGSIPIELRAKIRRFEGEGKVHSFVSELNTSHFDGELVHLTFKDGTVWSGKQIILATGFHSTAPGMDWLNQTINSRHLRCHTCGYPILDDHTLKWDDQLFVMGALAELSLGPVARNISGARRGAEKIIRAAY
ncbi:FAD/NAD(P)-binding protein [Alkalihalophilus sp. As8PL]|uniref:FAD/NAD(P)-binding protein n=1 Tax=Alkalihalophilus sp. As8PL TaxID=3237103 RepID=A0AB39BS38_9BACI